MEEASSPTSSLEMDGKINRTQINFLIKDRLVTAAVDLELMFFNDFIIHVGGEEIKTQPPQLG